MLSLRVVSTLEEFGGLSSQWNSLLTKTSANNIFLTWEWVYTWARHYLQRDTLFILLAYQGNEIVGIAPLCIKKANYYGLLGIRQMEFLGTKEVCSSYLDFIVEDKRRKQLLQSVYNYLYCDARGLWDILRLAEIPVESPTTDMLYEIVQDEGKTVEIVGHTCCPVIRLPGSVDKFLGSISRNERYNLRRKSSRLEKLCDAQYIQCSLNGDVQKEMNTFVSLQRLNWKHKGRDDGRFQSNRFLEFHKEVLSLFSERGWARLDFLALDGKKIAGIYGYSYNGTYYFYLPARNPTIFPELSTGILLLFRSVSQAIQDGNREFDLLRDPAPYKLAWANGLRRSLTLRLYNSNLRSAAFKMADSGKAAAKMLLR